MNGCRPVAFSVKKQMHCVMFFGTNDYAWIEEVPFYAKKCVCMLLFLR